MKRTLQRTLGAALLSWSALQADSALEVDLDQVPFGSVQLPGKKEDSRAFKLSVGGEGLTQAKLNHSREHKGHINYNIWEANLRFIFWYNPEYTEGAYTTLGYSSTYLKWNHNPFFKQNRFDTVDVTLGVFTQRICKWLWLAHVNINQDAQHWDPGEYMFWDALFWGRYTYREDIGVHVGLVVETGMKIDHVYPIVGFDWTINEQWKLNAVFPVNMSIVYTICDDWTVSLAGRIFDERFRAEKHAELPKALVQYENAGIELATDYDWNDWLDFNIHAGYAFGGELKIADKHYHHKHRIKFGSSAYIGGEVGMKF